MGIWVLHKHSNTAFEIYFKYIMMFHYGDGGFRVLTSTKNIHACMQPKQFNFGLFQPDLTVQHVYCVPKMGTFVHGYVYVIRPEYNLRSKLT